ncbi:DUF3168 domain-containing protein [Facklamia hominis]|uniref:DUF3168 domain-containing protein n=1 Tax=Facklamia hominis CCUG 36813 TaxID=883111 RepID=K1LQR0_9LACT|nr:DUF3168 domain-containing protein [Facklamia hominis]EKB54462.1 hypothetical protein HMPREF9706_00652 [Facklamia hominis CCUG 36813]
MIDQLLFDEVFIVSTSLGYKTYDTLPDLAESYPFVVLEEVQVAPRGTKSKMIGRVFMTISIWCDGNDRGLASDMMNAILLNCMNISESDGIRFMAVPSGCGTRMLEDTSIGKSLWHGVVELEFKFA